MKTRNRFLRLLKISGIIGLLGNVSPAHVLIEYRPAQWAIMGLSGDNVILQYCGVESPTKEQLGTETWKTLQKQCETSSHRPAFTENAEKYRASLSALYLVRTYWTIVGNLFIRAIQNRRQEYDEPSIEGTHGDVARFSQAEEEILRFLGAEESAVWTLKTHEGSGRIYRILEAFTPHFSDGHIVIRISAETGIEGCPASWAAASLWTIYSAFDDAETRIGFRQWLSKYYLDAAAKGLAPSSFLVWSPWEIASPLEKESETSRKREDFFEFSVSEKSYAFFDSRKSELTVDKQLSPGTRKDHATVIGMGKVFSPITIEKAKGLKALCFRRVLPPVEAVEEVEGGTVRLSTIAAQYHMSLSSLYRLALIDGTLERNLSPLIVNNRGISTNYFETAIKGRLDFLAENTDMIEFLTVASKNQSATLWSKPVQLEEGPLPSRK